MLEALKLQDDPTQWKAYLCGKRLHSLFRCLFEPEVLTEAEREQAMYLYSLDEDPREALASLSHLLTEMDDVLSRRRERARQLLLRASYEGSIVSVDPTGFVVRFALEDDIQTRRFSHEQVNGTVREHDVVEVESILRRQVVGESVTLDPGDQDRWKKEMEWERQARPREPKGDPPE